MLLAEGHHVEGVHLLMHEHSDPTAAQRSADELGIRLHIIDCRDDFAKIVKRNFIDNYTCGQTPNPCVVCNRHVKFAALCRTAQEHGLDKVVTGHYANIAKHPTTGRYAVRRARDASKDQSYMLWSLTQEQLAMMHLPLSDSIKAELRRAAQEKQLSVADTEESMDICFIPDGDYAAYIDRHAAEALSHSHLEGDEAEMNEGGAKKVFLQGVGDFVDTDGRILGQHKGIIHYTVGQRKGLGIAAAHPLYVTQIDAAANRVTLGRKEELLTTEMTLTGLNFQAWAKPDSDQTTEWELDVRIRYKSPPIPTKVRIVGDTAHVTFPQPTGPITPGQSAVFFDGECVAFGGVIG